MDKLAIYYGYPSKVHGFNEKPGSVDDAILNFLNYDIVVFGAGLEVLSHPDFRNAIRVIYNLNEQNKEAYGYIHLGVNCPEYNCYSDGELEKQLIHWKDIGAKGALYDLLQPEYNAPIERIKRLSDFAHRIGLNVFYNTNLDEPDCDGEWVYQRVVPFARKNDIMLIEPFGTSWRKDSHQLPDELPKPIRKMQKKGVRIAGVSTYDPEKVSLKTEEGKKVLKERYAKYKKEAERLSLDAYQYTNKFYSAIGEPDTLIDFDKLM